MGQQHARHHGGGQGSPDVSSSHYPTFGHIYWTVGTEGKEDGQFFHPTTVAINSLSQVFICDSGNNRVQVFDKDGKYVNKFGSKGNGKGEFDSPFCVATDSEDNIIVTDSGNYRVQVFDKNFNYLFEYGSKGNGDGQFESPKGVVTNTNDRAIVVDCGGSSSVQMFDNTGKFLVKYDAEAPDTKFTGHKYVAVDRRNNNIIITDTMRNCLRIFAEDGKLLFTYPYEEPFDVAVADNGDIVMVDNNHGLRVFDEKMNKLHRFDKKLFQKSDHPSAMGIAVDHKLDQLVIVEALSNKIHKIGFAPLKL